MVMHGTINVKVGKKSQVKNFDTEKCFGLVG
jgi:hypothetical protein